MTEEREKKIKKEKVTKQSPKGVTKGASSQMRFIFYLFFK